MAHLNYFRPAHAKLKTVEPCDFDEPRLCFNDKDFNEMITKLCLADLFLVEFTLAGLWRRAVKILDAYTCVFACNICRRYCPNAGELVAHLKTRTHAFKVKQALNKKNSPRYYHPVFTYTLKHDLKFQKGTNAKKNHPPRALYKVPRLVFLYAHIAAKMVEDEMKSKGIEMFQHTIEYSGKRIVENATQEELDEAATKLQHDKLKNLEKNKMIYQENLEKLQKTKKKQIKKGDVRGHIISIKERRRINGIRETINLLSGEVVIPNDPFGKQKKVKSDEINSEISNFDGSKKNVDEFCAAAISENVENRPSRRSFNQPFNEPHTLLRRNTRSRSPIRGDRYREQDTHFFHPRTDSRSFQASQISGRRMVQTPRVRDEEHFQGDAKTSKNVDVIAVIRLLAAFDEDMGSIGPKILDLLGSALQMSKRLSTMEFHAEVLTLDNCRLIEDAIEELENTLMKCNDKKAQALTDIIQKSLDLLRYASSSTVQINRQNLNVSPRTSDFTGYNEDTKRNINEHRHKIRVSNELEHEFYLASQNKKRNYNRGEEMFSSQREPHFENYEDDRRNNDSRNYLKHKMYPDNDIVSHSTSRYDYNNYYQNNDNSSRSYSQLQDPYNNRNVRSINDYHNGNNTFNSMSTKYENNDRQPIKHRNYEFDVYPNRPATYW